MTAMLKLTTSNNSTDGPVQPGVLPSASRYAAVFFDSHLPSSLHSFHRFIDIWRAASDFRRKIGPVEYRDYLNILWRVHRTAIRPATGVTSARLNLLARVGFGGWDLIGHWKLHCGIPSRLDHDGYESAGGCANGDSRHCGKRLGLAAPAAPHRPTEVSQRFAAQASYSSGLNQPPLAVRLGAS